MASPMSAESCHCAFDDSGFERPGIDGTLLMELLEEPGAEDADDDRLGCVIRSLEAELGHAGPSAGGGGAAGALIDCEDCGLEGIMCDFDGHSCSRSTEYVDDEDPFSWPEMAAPPIEDVGRWYFDTCMDDDGMVGFGDPRDYGDLCYGEPSIEQVYVTLWQ